MLVEFSVGNFRSFKETVTLSMVAANLNAKEISLDANNTFEPETGPRLLTSAAIYGANASGKSNLVNAIRFMRYFVLNSPKETRPTGDIDVEPFRLSSATIDQPSHFEMVFIAEGRRFRYGFETTTERVEREWLYHVPHKREGRLFERLKDDIELSDTFREGKEIGGRTRPNALFLSVVAQFNGPVAQTVIKWFRELGVASGLADAGMRMYTLRQFENGAYRNDIKELMKRLDLGIDDVIIEKTSAPKREIPDDMPEPLRTALATITNWPEQDFYVVSTVHTQWGNGDHVASRQLFNLDDQESEGTKKLFSMTGPLIRALKTGRILVIDEFDARLHSLMSREIIKLFNSKQTNPNHAQLIVTTQDTNLLDNRFFRRDQIWFTEKDRFGATRLYSLAEFKVRNDASFERDYARGRYGAIPFPGNLPQLLEES